MAEILQKIMHEFSAPFSNSILSFSLILFIILLSPLILRIFKVPNIIGLIIAGLLIGPHGLNLIEKNAAVELFSTIGLLYIMFIAGLELDLNDFRRNKHKSLLFGLMTFVLPISIGFPVCYYLLNYDFTASLLIASMFATHTLVGYPIVGRLGIAKNEAVAIAVGGTIFTDTAVLVILAVIVASAKGVLSPEFWLILALSFGIFILIVSFIIPKIATWFFKKLEAEKNSHFIFVLAVVFFCAFMAELAGLEPIIGAFAAGISLNRLIPHTSMLMNRIDFVGNSLFIPFFLISVGMIVDFKVIFAGPTAIVVALTLTAVAMTGKWLAALVTSWLVGYSKSQRRLIFGLSNSHAAATLAIILVGFQLKLIDETVLNGTIILILISCVVASFVTENAARKIVIEEEPLSDGNIPLVSDQKILLPISNPDTYERLVDLAITLKKRKNSSPIFTLSVVDDDEKAQVKILEAKKILENALLHAAATDQKVKVVTTIAQNVADGIKRVVKETFATDIILGSSQKSNISDILFGSKIQNIVNQLTQTVMVNNIKLPLPLHTRIAIFCPAYSEKEYGFTSWIQHVQHIAENLGLPAVFYSSAKTNEAIMNYLGKGRKNINASYIDFEDWGAYRQVADHLTANDLIVVVTPRPGSVSFDPEQDEITAKMAKIFKSKSFLFIYPLIEELIDSENIDGGFIEKSLAQFNKTAKKISRFFKRRG